MLIAYHNNQSEKDAILSQLRSHRRADELVKGRYWENGKGCAVGCTVHSSDHAEYETRFGIPIMLAYLEDAIFEGLPNTLAQKWPERLMSAIAPGADLSMVGWQLQHWLLTNEDVNPGISHPLVRDAVIRCAAVVASLAHGTPVDDTAESAAESAESAAWSAAESAARSAAESAARSAAESAAWSARSAASAARSAAESAMSAAAVWSAARSAASAARSARSAAAVWSAAESATCKKIAVKLIRLIEDAPLST